MPTAIEEFDNALQEHQELYGVQLSKAARERLGRYYGFLLKWNDRLHLVAPSAPSEFATRHVLESLMLIRHLPTKAHVADVGSGAGLPIIPCLIARDDLQATLIESAAKKAIFLREALREGAGKRARVVAKRFQDMAAPDARFITCRALDRFEQLLPELIDWSPEGSTMLLFAGEVLLEKIESVLSDLKVERVPNSERRFLLIVKNRKTKSPGHKEHEAGQGGVLV
jgi:16S rRNA (guanine527-N7)-methyltransferase